MRSWRYKMFEGLPRGTFPEGFAKSQARTNPAWSKVMRASWLRWAKRKRAAGVRSWANEVSSGITSWERGLRRSYQKKIQRIRAGNRRCRLGRNR